MNIKLSEIKKAISKRVNSKALVTTLALLGLGSILVSWEHFDQGGIAQLESTTPAFARDTKGLHITAKKYTGGESRDYLDRNLLNHGFQPVQVTIQNNTADSYNLSREGISQPTASVSKVANAIFKKSLPRSIGLKVASLFFWPLMIPSTVEGIYSLKTHLKIRKDYTAKAVKDQDEEILPYTVFHRVIFVPTEELRETLTVTLISKDDKTPISYISPILDSEEKVQLDLVE